MIQEEVAEKVRIEERAKMKIENEKIKTEVKGGKTIINITLDIGYSNEEIISTLQRKLNIIE